MITDIVSINPALSIITLNVNGLYTPIKRQTIQVDYKKKKKQDPTICYLHTLNVKIHID